MLFIGIQCKHKPLHSCTIETVLSPVAMWLNADARQEEHVHGRRYKSNTGVNTLFCFQQSCFLVPNSISIVLSALFWFITTQAEP